MALTTSLPEPAPSAAVRTPPIRLPGGGLPLLRWALLVLLLISEVIGISMSFDAAARRGDPGWAGAVITWSPSFLRWALVTGVGVVILGAWCLGDAIRDAGGTRHTRRGLAVWGFAHLGALLAFTLVTARVLDANSLATPMTGWELAAWAGTGLLTVGCWAAAVLPLRAWMQLLLRGRYVLIAAGLVGAAASLVSAVSREGWDSLSGPTIWGAHAVLRTVTPETVCDPPSRLLGTPGFRVRVGVPCSGYEGMGLILAYLTVYLFLFRRDLRFPHALLLLPLGLTAVWVVNVVRIAALILIGDRVSPKLAVGGFHSQAGWIGFNLVALTLVYATHRFHLFAKDHIRSTRSGHPTAAYLTPLLAGIAIQMLTVAATTNPVALYPGRVVASAVLLWYFWPWYTCLRTADPVSSAAELHAPGRTGLRGVGLATSVGIVIFLAWIALVPVQWRADRPTALPSATAGWPTWAVAAWMVCKVGGFVLVTPLAEELAFRGYLMRRLIATDFEQVPPGRFTWLSFLLPSLVFGLLHGHWVAGTLAGLAYASVVVRTGRVRDAVVAHALTNGLLLGMMVLTGEWQE